MGAFRLESMSLSIKRGFKKPRYGYERRFESSFANGAEGLKEKDRPKTGSQTSFGANKTRQ
jgi:hypothetical protein